MSTNDKILEGNKEEVLMKLMKGLCSKVIKKSKWEVKNLMR
jgi:hypothetical protein